MNEVHPSWPKSSVNFFSFWRSSSLTVGFELRSDRIMSVYLKKKSTKRLSFHIHGTTDRFIFCSKTTKNYVVCSGSVVVTSYDFESGHPGSNPEWGPIYYKVSITAQGLPEPSSLRGSTLGTRAAEHKGCNWACKLTDGCSLESCVWPHLQWAVASSGICHRNKNQLNCMQHLCDWGQAQ